MEKHGKIFVSVKDTGEGIAKDSLNKIWERFYKSDPSRGKDKKGTGLGLAIVKEIIQLTVRILTLLVRRAWEQSLHLHCHAVKQ